MEVQAEGDIRTIIQLTSKFGSQTYANLVFAYCELFGISPMKSHMKKLRLLLEEMAKLFEMESFTYRKKSYQISRKGIADALNEMAHRSFPDNLTGHNYLKKIMIGIAQEEARAQGRHEEEDLRDGEEDLKRGRHLKDGGRGEKLVPIKGILKTLK
ncbi:MAG: hypothetical protein JRD89_20295 [Deltaproteobacteria bacterium]|nr:hypothetical protein [Deltaproteobacteria bacterium]